MSPPPEEERAARMVLAATVEPGDPDAARLVRQFSAVELLARLRAGRLRPEKAVGWAERLEAVRLATVRADTAAAGARFVVPGDEEWPLCADELAAFEDGSPERRAGAPLGLWIRGPRSLGGLCGLAVAIVGARAATEYGLHVAGDLAAGCAQLGATVVSGAAYGIDAAAHRGALAVDGCTVAILAGGVDRATPSGLGAMLDAIAATGLVVSEAPPGTAPSRSRFLVRNRLIAALAHGTVVVEAARRSGALSTARWARDLNRIVMGVPGPVTSMQSAGVHELLRQPETTLVTTHDEVLELVAPLSIETGPLTH